VAALCRITFWLNRGETRSTIPSSISNALTPLGVAIQDRSIYFSFDDADARYVDGFLPPGFGRGSLRVCINSGGGWYTKRWGLDRFAPWQTGSRRSSTPASWIPWGPRPAAGGRGDTEQDDPGRVHPSGHDPRPARRTHQAVFDYCHERFRADAHRRRGRNAGFSVYMVRRTPCSRDHTATIMSSCGTRPLKCLGAT